MTPERKSELRRECPRPPENTRPDTSVVRREMNEALDALDDAERERNEALAMLREALDGGWLVPTSDVASRARELLARSGRAQ